MPGHILGYSCSCGVKSEPLVLAGVNVEHKLLCAVYEPETKIIKSIKLHEKPLSSEKLENPFISSDRLDLSGSKSRVIKCPACGKNELTVTKYGNWD